MSSHFTVSLGMLAFFFLSGHFLLFVLQNVLQKSDKIKYCLEYANSWKKIYGWMHVLVSFWICWIIHAICIPETSSLCKNLYISFSIHNKLFLSLSLSHTVIPLFIPQIWIIFSTWYVLPCSFLLLMPSDYLSLNFHSCWCNNGIRTHSTVRWCDF